MTDTTLTIDPFGFSSLEDELYGDSAGRRVVEGLDWVAAKRGVVDQQLGSGLHPDEHHRAMQLRDAFDAAAAILKTPPHKQGD